jgi:hypothetical protein
MDRSQTCVITLVHGTWGRGFFPKDYKPGGWPRKRIPPWFHEESNFHKRLTIELRNGGVEVRTKAFSWSGSNSVRHRASAAEELSKLLASDPPEARSIVIAHSHGGNVALKAISKLGSRAASIHLITLATPFLRAFPTRVGPSFWFSTLIFFVVLLFGFSYLTSYLASAGYNLSWDFPKPSPLTAIALVVLLFGLFAVVSAVLVRLIVNPAPSTGAHRYSEALTRLINVLAETSTREKTWPHRPFAIADAINYRFEQSSAPKILVVRGVDDEAAVILALGAFGTTLNRLMLTGLWPILVPAAGIISGVSFILGAFGAFDPMLGLKFAGYFYLFFIAGIVIFLVLPGLINCRFGKELGLGAARCEIAADSVPDWMGASVITLETPLRHPFASAVEGTQISGILRHKIYDYPDCVPSIVKWISTISAPIHCRSS